MNKRRILSKEECCMTKDNIMCCNCGFSGLVDKGEDKCPKCGFVGALAWKDGEEQEVCE
jgi:predicted RNA-binding Zn-ribbon protein involved in translation (DUF1610 family)